MSSNALVSQGMLLQLGDGASPEAFTTIPERNNISGPGGSATEIDVTDLDSTAKEFRLGLQDEGSISFEINYIPKNTIHAALRAARASGTQKNFKLVFTDSPNTVWSFAAFVNSFTIDNGVDNVTKGNVTLRVTGSITES